MSRVGKKIIDLPNGIDVSILENGITIKGAKGELNANFPDTVKLEKEQDKVRVIPLNDTKDAKASWGLTRTLINGYQELPGVFLSILYTTFCATSNIIGKE